MPRSSRSWVPTTFVSSAAWANYSSSALSTPRSVSFKTFIHIYNDTTFKNYNVAPSSDLLLNILPLPLTHHPPYTMHHPSTRRPVVKITSGV